MKAKLIKTDVNYILEDDKRVVIASTSLKKEGLSLSLKNCQAIERGYDLDELASHNSLSYTWLESNEKDKAIMSKYGIEGFKAGFQKALELMSDKIFTLDDIYTVFIMGREGMEDKMNRYVTRIHEPTEWDVEVEMENYEPLYGMGSTPRLKLDADGCLILKRI